MEGASVDSGRGNRQNFESSGRVQGLSEVFARPLDPMVVQAVVALQQAA